MEFLFDGQFQAESNSETPPPQPLDCKDLADLSGKLFIGNSYS